MAYPTSPDNLPANHVDNIGELILALHVNRLDTAVNALQGELGNLPKGSYASVKARLDAIAAGAALPTGGADRSTLTIKADGTTVWGAKATPYNIREAGADPSNSGTANVTAINSALTAAAGNGPCLVPPGVYQVGATTVDIPSQTHLVGTGAQQAVFKAPNAMPDGVVFRNSNYGGSSSPNTDITIENVTFDGNRVTRTGTPGASFINFRGHASAQVDRLVFRNCVIRENRGIGVSFDNCSRVDVNHNHVYNCDRDGIMVKACNQSRVIGNLVHDVGDDCISIHANSDLKTTGNKSRDIVVSGNIVGPFNDTHLGSNGIIITGTDNYAVTGNVCYLTDMWAIVVWSEGYNNSQGGVISGNVIRRAGQNFSNVDAGGGTLDEGGGIALKIAKTRVLDAAGQGGYGGTNTSVAPAGPTSAVGFTRDTIISNNVIEEPESHGIWLYSLDDVLGASHLNVRIVNNVIRGYPAGWIDGCGILFNDSRAAHIAIQNNLITGFNYAAIRFAAGPTFVQIQNNEIYSCCVGTGHSGVHSPVALGTVGDYVFSGNRVRDFATNHLNSVNCGTATLGWVHGNNFTGGAPTGNNVFGGTTPPARQAANLNHAGNLYSGTVPTGAVMP